MQTPSLIAEQVDLSPLERIMAEFKTAPVAPRIRQLDVRDDHAVVLLAAVADCLLVHRRLGMEAPLALLEMQDVLNMMVQS